jgi:ADP-ribose pyrophosphatase
VSGSEGEEPDLAAYRAFAAERPDLFQTPPGGVRIVQEPAEQRAVTSEMARRYAQRGWPADWAAAGLKYADPYLMVLRDAVVFPDGSPGVHHRAIRRQGDPSGVAILAQHGGRVLLLRHFRHPTRQFHWEAPRGAIEPGQTPEQAVAAELMEEVQASASAIRPLGRMYGATGFMGIAVLLYAAEIGGIGAVARGEGIVEGRFFAPAQLHAMLQAGELTDSFTLGLLLHAKVQGLLP